MVEQSRCLDTILIKQSCIQKLQSKMGTCVIFMFDRNCLLSSIYLYPPACYKFERKCSDHAPFLCMFLTEIYTKGAMVNTYLQIVLLDFNPNLMYNHVQQLWYSSIEFCSYNLVFSEAPNNDDAMCIT